MRYLMVILVLFLSACAKETVEVTSVNENPQNGLVINKAEAGFTDKVVYDPSFETAIQFISDVKWMIPVGTPNSDLITSGKIISLAANDSRPQGALIKVKMASIIGDQIFLDVEPAALDEFLNNLTLDIVNHSYEKALLPRSIQFEKQIADLLTLTFETDVTKALTLQPTIGMNGSLIYDLDFDLKNHTFHHAKIGYENFSFSGSILTSFAGKISGKASLLKIEDFAINLPSINLVVNGVPIVITNRLVPSPEVILSVNGGFEVNTTLNMTKPLTAILEIDPIKYPNGVNVDCKGTCDGPDFDFDIDVKQIDGGVESTMNIVWQLETGLYKTYDFLKLYLSAKAPSVTFTSALKTVDQETKINIKGSTSLPLEVGLESKKFQEYFGISFLTNPFKFEIETFKTALFDKDITIPCDIDFNVTRSPEVNCIPNVDDKIELLMRINSQNGSPSGYRIKVDGFEIGTAPYNSLHNQYFLARLMKPSSIIEVVDLESAFCRMRFTVKNPCEAIEFYCEGDPITDDEGQEYCVQTMADGRIWMSRNLFSTGGICHSNDPNACVEAGAYYDFEIVKNLGSSGLCPSGYRIPTSSEWNVLLDAESRKSSGNKKVSHLFAPNLVNFGNVGSDQTSGFNILPAGYYQAWKTNLPLAQRFTNGYLDQSPFESAYFWTSDEAASKTDLPGGGAYAMRLYASGQYGIVAMPQKAGLNCRCVKE